jgi:GNAT superfamily N-acetyltransferase
MAKGDLAGLAPAGLRLRAVTAADRPFLEALFCSVRWDELAPTGWPDDAKIAFLASQFDFQQRHYVDAFPDADYMVIERDGAAIGRIYVDCSAADLHLVEISLLPVWRRKGIGAALIGSLQNEVRAGRARRVRLSVDRTNPDAHRLYQRLGFVEDAPTSPYPGMSIEMTYAGDPP